METMHFNMAHTKMFLRTTSSRIQGVPMNNLTPMKNCPGEQGNTNWMSGYKLLSQYKGTGRIECQKFVSPLLGRS